MVSIYCLSLSNALANLTFVGAWEVIAFYLIFAFNAFLTHLEQAP